MSEQTYDYDLFVIGAGSGGVRAARFAGGFGARVAIAEERYLGGTCVNVGCVPKKLFVYASEFASAFTDARGFGWNVGETSFDWQTLVQNKNTEIERLNGIYGRLLGNTGVKLYESRATFIDNHTLDVGGERVTAKTILVATGGRPRPPFIPGAEHAITSDEVFFLEELPEKIVIVGGGYISVEFAGIFNGLGVDVTLAIRGDGILRGFDEDIRSMVENEMRRQGINIRTQTHITKIVKQEDGQLAVSFQEGDTLVAGQVMYAIGRIPNTQGLGLNHTDIETNSNGSIIVDDYLRTTAHNIYALGDVIDRVQLTPVATAEGMMFARNLYQPETPNYRVSYENIPTAVFSQPTIGTVGYTEADARAKFGEVDIYRSSFKPMKSTLSGGEGRILMKLIVDCHTDIVVGVHMAGPYAGEIIQGFGVALKAGATKEVFDSTIGIHPTSAEEFVTMRTKVTE